MEAAAAAREGDQNPAASCFLDCRECQVGRVGLAKRVESLFHVEGGPTAARKWAAGPTDPGGPSKTIIRQPVRRLAVLRWRKAKHSCGQVGRRRSMLLSFFLPNFVYRF